LGRLFLTAEVKQAVNRREFITFYGSLDNVCRLPPCDLVGSGIRCARQLEAVRLS